MKILYDLQLSVVDSMNDGKFLMRTDSNVNVASFTIKGLLKKNSGIEIYLITPNILKTTLRKDENFLTEDLSEFKDRLHFAYYDYFGNPFMDRMTFDSRELSKALKDAGNPVIDLVYANDPCKVLAYKTFFYYEQKKFIPVISRNHWVTGIADRKVPIEIDFDIRQAEGALKGDWMTFNSNFAKKQFLENNAKILKDLPADKLDSFEMVDLDKVDKYQTNDAYPLITILWAHRLSYYTGWKETLDSLNLLWKKRKDFQVFVPDPGNKFKQSDLKNMYPFITEINKDSWTHEDYLRLCWMSDICLGNHKYPATWGGLSITEPMAAHTVPIMPNKWAYPEMMWKEDIAPVFFNDETEMNVIIEHYLDNIGDLVLMKDSARRFCEKNLNPNNYISKIYDKIVDLIYPI